MYIEKNGFAWPTAILRMPWKDEHMNWLKANNAQILFMGGEAGWYVKVGDVWATLGCATPEDAVQMAIKEVVKVRR